MQTVQYNFFQWTSIYFQIPALTFLFFISFSVYIFICLLINLLMEKKGQSILKERNIKFVAMKTEGNQKTINNIL